MAELFIRYTGSSYAIQQSAKPSQSEIETLNWHKLSKVSRNLNILLAEESQSGFLDHLFGGLYDRQREAWIELLEELASKKNAEEELTIKYINHSDSKQTSRKTLTLPDWLAKAVSFAKIHEYNRKRTSRSFSGSRKAFWISSLASVLSIAVWAGYPIYQAVHVSAEAASKAFTTGNPWVIAGLVIFLLGAAVAATAYVVGKRQHSKAHTVWLDGRASHVTPKTEEPNLDDGVEVVGDEEAVVVAVVVASEPGQKKAEIQKIIEELKEKDAAEKAAENRKSKSDIDIDKEFSSDDSSSEYDSDGELVGCAL